MIDESKAIALFLEKLKAWQASQLSQTSGYEYERNYEQFIQSLSGELLQESMGSLPKDRNQKKLVTKFGSITVPKVANLRVAEKSGQWKKSSATY